MPASRAVRLTQLFQGTFGYLALILTLATLLALVRAYSVFSTRTTAKPSGRRDPSETCGLAVFLGSGPSISRQLLRVRPAAEQCLEQVGTPAKRSASCLRSTLPATFPARTSSARGIPSACKRLSTLRLLKQPSCPRTRHMSVSVHPLGRSLAAPGRRANGSRIRAYDPRRHTLSSRSRGLGVSTNLSSQLRSVRPTP